MAYDQLTKPPMTSAGVNSVREPLVPLCLNDIKNKQEELHEAIANLEHRLGPVLQLDCQVPNAKNTEAESQEPELIMRLKEILHDTTRMAVTIRNITNRLEV